MCSRHPVAMRRSPTCSTGAVSSSCTTSCSAPRCERGQHCSFLADHYDGPGLHLPYRDVSFVVVSRAPLAQIEAFKQRMGWRFKWVSSGGSDFNYDLGVSFTPDQVEQGTMVYNYEPADAGGRDREGLSVFYKSPDGTGLPHLLLLRAGNRVFERDLSFPRSRPQGPRRESGRSPELGQTPRSLRTPGLMARGPEAARSSDGRGAHGARRDGLIRGLLPTAADA